MILTVAWVVLMIIENKSLILKSLIRGLVGKEFTPKIGRVNDSYYVPDSTDRLSLQTEL